MTQDPPRADAPRHAERRNAQRDTPASVRRRTDERLDEALKATFPASDPFALTDVPDATMPEEAADR